MEWQPIETAPKDGTWVLLRGGITTDEADNVSRVVSGQWTDYLNGRHSPEYAGWHFAWYDGGYYGYYKNPSHWMPLPEPPK